MKHKHSIMFSLIVLVLASLACSLFSGGNGDGTTPETALENQAGVSFPTRILSTESPSTMALCGRLQKAVW